MTRLNKKIKRKNVSQKLSSRIEPNELRIQ